MRTALLMLGVGLLLTALSGNARANQPWHGDYFPNVVLTDQDGKKHKFYDDIIKDKIVALNFIYTRCKDVCPADTARLTRVQDMLGDRVGKDIFMYSISLEPQHDTPKVLKDYMHMFGVKPGWMFLTGKKADIDLLQKKLGMVGQDIPALREHNTSFMMGNETAGQWIKRSPYDDPKILSILLSETLNNNVSNEERQPYSAAPQMQSRSTGDYIFRTRCTSCHTIGNGDRLGPDLSGVTLRRSKEWLMRWLKEPDKMISKKDPIALDMMRRYRNLPMPNLGMNDVDAAALFDFLQNPDKDTAAPAAEPAPH